MQRVLVVEDSKVVQQVLRHLAAHYLDVAVDFAAGLGTSLPGCGQSANSGAFPAEGQHGAAPAA